jgi:hypothetical protein
MFLHQFLGDGKRRETDKAAEPRLPVTGRLICKAFGFATSP